MKYLSTGKGFPGDAKNPPANARGIRDTGLIPGLRRSPGALPTRHTDAHTGPRENQKYNLKNQKE